MAGSLKGGASFSFLSVVYVQHTATSCLSYEKGIQVSSSFVLYVETESCTFFFFFNIYIGVTPHPCSVAFSLVTTVFLFHNICLVTSNHWPLPELFSSFTAAQSPSSRKSVCCLCQLDGDFQIFEQKKCVRSDIIYDLFRAKTFGKRATSFKKCIQNILPKKAKDLLVQQTRNYISPHSANCSLLLHYWDLIAPVRHGKLTYFLCTQRCCFLQTA